MNVLIRHAFARCALVVAFAASAFAQDRHAHPVKVVDADGKPVADADVALLATVLELPEAGPIDVVRGKCDAQGRAKVELLDGVDYLVWATTATARSAALPIERGRQSELKLAAGDAKVTVRGLEPWAASAPFRLRVWIDGVRGLCDDVAIENGAATLPPLPADHVQFAVLDKDGAQLGERDRDRQLTMLAPYELHAVAVDEQGKPVAGAVIEELLQTYDSGRVPMTNIAGQERVRRGVTDADGKVLLRVPCRRDPFAAEGGWLDLRLLASKDGCVPSLSGFTQGLYCDGAKVDEEARAKKELRFVLRAGESLAGRVLAAPAAMPKTFVLLGEAHVAIDQNSWMNIDLRMTVAVAADGAFAVPPPTRNGRWKAAIVSALPPPAAGAVPDPFARCWARQAMRLQLTEGKLDLDLAHAEPVRLQFIGADKTPAAGAYVTLIAESNGGYEDGVPPMGRTDQLGRFACTLPDGKWLAFVCDREGSVLQVIEPSVAAGKPIVLTREPFAHMRIQVVDGNGKPIAGAHSNICETSWRGDSNRIEDARRMYASHLGEWLIDNTTSDAEGRMDLRFLPAQGFVRKFKLETERGDERVHSSLLVLSDENELTKVEIR